MRGFSIVLTLAFVLATPSLAGSSEQGAPGVGTFAYGGSPSRPADRFVHPLDPVAGDPW